MKGQIKTLESEKKSKFETLPAEFLTHFPVFRLLLCKLYPNHIIKQRSYFIT